MLLTRRQTNKQTNKLWQKHYLFGGGNYTAYRRYRFTSIILVNAKFGGFIAPKDFFAIRVVYSI